MPEQTPSVHGIPWNEIGAIAGAMTAIFALLSFFLPTSLIGPIMGLSIGLIVTGVIIWKKKISPGTAIATWVGGAVFVVVVYFVISQPATVTGIVLDLQSTPVSGSTLVLTDSSGVDHKTVTDENGAFEFKSVPEGKYTILINSKLLTSGDVPSGWQRIFYPRVKLPALAYQPPETATPTPTVTPTMMPSLTPTASATIIPSETPYPGCKVEDFEAARKVTWFSPDPNVFSYGESDLHAHSGALSFRVVYNKTDTYQFMGAADVSCCFLRGLNQELRVWVYGDVTLLVKLEDERLRQAEIGIGHATDPNGWTLLTFDYSNAASQINLGRLKTILFFPAPGDHSASGEFFMDDIELYPYDAAPGDCPQSIP